MGKGYGVLELLEEILVAIKNLGSTDGVRRFNRGEITISEFIEKNINLGAPPKLPFKGAEVVKHEGTGIVEIELGSDDNLYLDGKKVELFLSERQKGNKSITGHQLRQELESGEQILLNRNVLDYLYGHPELFPEHWKKDENGNTRFIFFWGSIFRNPTYDYLYVCALCWLDGGLFRDYSWIVLDWDRQHSSASVTN